MREASEEQVAALQERIRRAGRAVTFAWRFVLFGYAISLPAIGIIWLAQSIWPVAAYRFLYGVLCVVPGPAVAACVARSRLRRLERELHVLRHEQIQEVLLPLQSAAGETGELTRALLRGLKSPTDLVPADSPVGRGDEPSAAV